MAKLGDLLKKILASSSTSGEDVDALARELDFLQRNGSNTANLLQGSEIVKPLLLRALIQSSIFDSTQGWQIDGAGNAVFRSATISNGSVQITSGGVTKIQLQSDGDAFFGSDISAAGTTSFVIFSNAQTYNSESMPAGAVLMGDNSSGKPNVLWNPSTGKMLVRSGTTVAGEITGGTFKRYGCQIDRAAVQSIPNATNTLVVFDTETSDDAGFYNPTTNYCKNPSAEVNVTDDWVAV